MDGEANGSQEITEGAQEQVQEQGQGQQTASRQIDEGDEAGNAIAPNYDRGIRLLADIMDVEEAGVLDCFVEVESELQHTQVCWRAG